MRFLLTVLLVLISSSAIAQNTQAPAVLWPKGCTTKCQGWMFYYEPKPDKFGKIHHEGDVGYFVSNVQLTPSGEFAKTEDIARTVADRHMLTNNNPASVVP